MDEEDFDKAKFIKDAIDKLKLAGSQLVQLELQKCLAVENEDFDSAKVLKLEVERLKSLAMNLDAQRVIEQPYHQSYHHQSHRGAINPHHQAIEV